MGDEEFTGAEEAVPRKKANMTTIIIVVVVAVVMGAAGFFAGRLSLTTAAAPLSRTVQLWRTMRWIPALSMSIVPS